VSRADLSDRLLSCGVRSMSLGAAAFVCLAWLWTAHTTLVMDGAASQLAVANVNEPVRRFTGTAAANVNVLVGFHSTTGWTEALSSFVVEGARKAQKPVAAVTVLTKRLQNVSCEELLWADVVLVGTPVYFTTISSQAKLFIENIQLRCFDWPSDRMVDKVGGAFVTGGQTSCGKDAAMQAVVGAFNTLGMVVVGGQNSWGASATHPDDAAAISFSKAEQEQARWLGARAVYIAALIKLGKAVATK